MLKHINYLQRSELFGTLTEDELCVLTPFCRDYVVIEDAMIFTEGRQASYLYVLTEGKVALQKFIRAPHARRSRRTTITLCYPGETVGWSSLVAPHNYTFSAVAWESSKLIRIDAQVLRKALNMYPELGFKVMSALSSVTCRRLRNTMDALISERTLTFSGLKECNHTDVA